MKADNRSPISRSPAGQQAVGRYRTRLVPPVLAYAAILVAFFLRAYRLADKNVWWDEGWSIWLSQKDLAWIALRTAADEHPPLHYWMLHFWNALAGTDAFAGRFLSVAFGVLTIALIYRIGKRTGGPWLGILAALFLATARFHVWWSQDIKNYTPSIFFAFAAVWFALDVMAGEAPSPAGGGGKGWGESASRRALLAMTTWKLVFAYALCAALAVLTHYLAALIVLALNLYAVLVFTRQFQVSSEFFHHSSSVLRPWIIANALALLFFTPWLVLYLQNAQAWSAAPVFDFGLFLKLVATVLPLGVTTNIENYAALTIALTTIATLGCVYVIASETPPPSPSPASGGGKGWGEIASSSRELHKTPRNDPLLFALIVLLPPFLIYILSLTPVSFFAPKIQARYLVSLVPAYALLLALGIATLRNFSIYLALAATFLVLAASAFVLNDYYADRRLRDEYATLANTINSFARQGDLVLLDTDQEWPTFLYYLRAPLDWLGVPNGAEMSEADADAIVKRALARYDAVWLIEIPDALATDPERLLEKRLRRRDVAQGFFVPTFEKTYNNKRLILSEKVRLDPGNVLRIDRRNLTNVPRENFAPQYPRALQVDSNLRLLGYDLPMREASVGDTVYIATYWNVAETATIPIELEGIGIMTEHWPGGERVRVQTDFVIPPGVQGNLRILAGKVELTSIHVAPRLQTPFTGDISNRVDHRLGDAILLVGYALPRTKFSAAESVPITLYWRADRAAEKSYTVFVHLLGTELNAAQNNFLWGQVDRVPVGGSYPTTAWRADQIVADPYRVPIAINAPPGTYKIEVGMYDLATGTRLKLNDGSDSVILAEIEIVQ